jgi:hypothetical protein
MRVPRPGMQYMICCVNMAMSLCYWYNHIPNKPNLTRKPEDAVNSDYVFKILYDAEAGHNSAVVCASIDNK